MDSSKFPKTEIKLFEITNIDSHRTPDSKGRKGRKGSEDSKDSKGSKEFRVTQIKGAMRFWWRSFQYSENSKELLDRENMLFGGKIKSKNTFIKSPLRIRCLSEIEPNDELGKFKFPMNLKLLYPEGFDYFCLLQLVSYLGGVGRNTRKGNGCFSVREKSTTHYYTSNDKLAKQIVTTIEKCSNKNLMIKTDITSDFIKIHLDINKNNITYDVSDSYVNEIYIFQKINKNKFIMKMKKSGIKKIKEKHIIISCYSANENNVYPIVTIFGNSDLGKNAFEQFKKKLEES